MEERCRHYDDYNEIIYETVVEEPTVGRKAYDCKACVGERIFLLSRYGKLFIQRARTNTFLRKELTAEEAMSLPAALSAYPEELLKSWGFDTSRHIDWEDHPITGTRILIQRR